MVSQPTTSPMGEIEEKQPEGGTGVRHNFLCGFVAESVALWCEVGFWGSRLQYDGRTKYCPTPPGISVKFHGVEKMTSSPPPKDIALDMSRGSSLGMGRDDWTGF